MQIQTTNVAVARKGAPLRIGFWYFIKCISFLGKIALVIAFAFPFFWMVSTSLQTLRETMALTPTWLPASPQWENYRIAWERAPFGLYTRNSIIVTFSTIGLQLLTMIPAAYAFAKYEFFGKRFLFGWVLLAFMIPNQVTFLPVYLMMARWGLLPTLLPQIIPFIHNAFGIFLLRQYFMQIPEELVESARLDNAGEFTILYKIMLPIAKPALAIIALFSFVANWNDYFWPLIMTDTVEVRPLTMGVALLFETESVQNWNIIMAGNMFLIMPVLVVYAITSKWILGALEYAGIK